MTNISTKQIFLFIYRVLKHFPLPVAMMFAVAIIWSLDISLRPYFLKVLLNRLESQSAHDIHYLLVPACLYLAMAFLVSTMYRLYDYFVQFKMIPKLREKIAGPTLGNLLNQSHHFFQNNFAGNLGNKFSNLAGDIPEIVQIVIDMFFSHSLAITIAVIALWQINMVFALAMLSWVLFFIILALFLLKKQVHLADIWSEWGSSINGRVVDVLSNILTVRLFARKQIEKQSLSQAFDNAVKAERNLQWSYLWMWVWYGYSFVLVLGVSMYFLLKGWQEGWVSVGDFAMVLGINTTIVEFLWQLAKEFSQFSKLVGRVSQALRAVLTVPEIQDSSEAKPLAFKRGEIVFEKVHFQYKEADALFEDKSVVITPGQKVGLVGYSGSGKTTFVNLILRLFDVTGGRILIDGQNIREVTQDSLHTILGMIPQDPTLFHRTLMENIRYGRLEATDAEVIAAAKLAHAHEFITKQPEGYESMVGERGIKLSGGQRQRIAIARAILKNAPVLILDEATSQLDSITENFIQESLQQLMQNKTTLVIAHRLSTLLHMERILVFDKGKIVEDGDHKSLLAKKGLYKTLWDAQVGGFLPEYKA